MTDLMKRNVQQKKPLKFDPAIINGLGNHTEGGKTLDISQCNLSLSRGQSYLLKDAN